MKSVTEKDKAQKRKNRKKSKSSKSVRQSHEKQKYKYCFKNRDLNSEKKVMDSNKEGKSMRNLDGSKNEGETSKVRIRNEK